MTPKIPIPTDNIYKFYALFGLSLLIASIVSFSIIATSANEEFYKLMKENYKITYVEKSENKSNLIKIIESQMVNQVTRTKSFSYYLGWATGFSFVLMLFGFGMWQFKIQPRQDEYFNLQIKALEKEIENSNK